MKQSSDITFFAFKQTCSFSEGYGGPKMAEIRGVSLCGTHKNVMFASIHRCVT
jgi:hypothetical protein